MSNRSHLFEYGDGPYAAPRDRFVAEVPIGVDSVASLFSALVQVLVLPEYFGRNWNALSDCLRDFHWMTEREVVLVHRELPAVPIAELTVYLDVLAQACESWQPGEEHALRVVFPKAARPEVVRLLDAAP